MTYYEIKAIEKRLTSLFKSRANKWEMYGNGYKTREAYEKEVRSIDKKIDVELAKIPCFSSIDYPGLYPSFKTIDGISHYDIGSVLNHVLIATQRFSIYPEVSKRWMQPNEDKQP